jgi:hypothetical protein
VSTCLELHVSTLDPYQKAAECPRQVGVCLKHLPDDPTQRFNGDTVPWQRVRLNVFIYDEGSFVSNSSLKQIINAKGGISARYVVLIFLAV